MLTNEWTVSLRHNRVLERERVKKSYEVVAISYIYASYHGYERRPQDWIRDTGYEMLSWHTQCLVNKSLTNLTAPYPIEEIIILWIWGIP